MGQRLGAPSLILASASPRRRELLARLGIEPARVVHADIDETPRTAELPRDYAQRMAREKAEAAADASAFVLAGDTVVAVGRRILPKAEGLIAWISGSHSGVVGLPLFETRALLKAAGLAVG